MKQIFGTVQSIILGVSGLFISWILLRYAQKSHFHLFSKSNEYDWIQGWILPAIIMTIILMIVFIPSKK